MSRRWEEQMGKLGKGQMVVVYGVLMEGLTEPQDSRNAH